MSFVGSMLSNSNGSGYQAAGQGVNQGAVNDSLSNLQSNNAALQQEAQGGGPVNQATQAALTGATNNGIKQAAGTVASQKGINPALATRLAGQNAAQSTQQAANAGAALTAQNAMAAQSQLSQNALGQYGIAQGGVNSANQANAGIAAGNQQAQQQIAGGLLGGIGSALGLSKGGVVPKMADGGDVSSPSAFSKFMSGYSNAQPSSSQNKQPIASGIASFGKGLNGIFKSSAASASPATDPNLSSGAAMGEAMGASPMDVFMTEQVGNYANGGIMGLASKAAPIIAANPEILAALNKGGKVKAMVSPGEKYLSPQQAKAVAAGKADAIKSGKTIPGKAPFPHKNTVKNDVVPADLQQGGVVIPIEVLESKNPHREASKFVAAALMHHKLAKKYPGKR